MGSDNNGTTNNGTTNNGTTNNGSGINSSDSSNRAWPAEDSTIDLGAAAPLEQIPPDLQELTKTAATMKAGIADMEAELKKLKERFGVVCNLIIKTLELMEVDSLKAHGYLFYKEQRSSVQTPKTPEDKEAFFSYLQEKGIFHEMVSINSMTLNSLYRNMAEDAAKEGVLDFRMPGIPEPTTYTNLKLKRA